MYLQVKNSCIATSLGRSYSLTFLVSFDELVMCKDRLQVLAVCGVIHRDFLVVNKLVSEMWNPILPRSQPRKAPCFNKYFDSTNSHKTRCRHWEVFWCWFNIKTWPLLLSPMVALWSQSGRVADLSSQCVIYGIPIDTQKPSGHGSG